MFTVKFYRSSDDSWQNVSCSRYESHPVPDGHIVCVYEKLHGGVGTEFRVSQGDWDACFVENAAGRTIDKYRA